MKDRHVEPGSLDSDSASRMLQIWSMFLLLAIEYYLK